MQLYIMLLLLPTLGLVLFPRGTSGFVAKQRQCIRQPATRVQSHPESIRPGTLLSDLLTPSLLLELSLADGAVPEGGTLGDILEDPTKFPPSTLDGALFVHTQVTSTTKRDSVTKIMGSGKSFDICEVDISQIPGGAYLGIGLANHHVGGYYWARGMGIGASLPAHGISFEQGQLYWKKRGPGDARLTTEENSNSNDGKRSEWADFLAVSDTVQLVPNSVDQVLKSELFSSLLGVRRIGRPLGADPIVEKVWIRSDGGWIPMS
jgi:hypothetical protein